MATRLFSDDQLEQLRGAVSTLLLLFLMTGSVVIPVKALIMNVPSLGASFGALKLVVQDGHLSGLLGFDSVGALDLWMPVLVLIFAFGLSMDYGVFSSHASRRCTTRPETTTPLSRSGYGGPGASSSSPPPPRSSSSCSPASPRRGAGRQAARRRPGHRHRRTGTYTGQ